LGNLKSQLQAAETEDKFYSEHMFASLVAFRTLAVSGNLIDQQNNAGKQ
jgi:hypothetical protein